jgi:NTP pyrophosphatase (non-canonical NTP hydrolase)
MASPQFNGLTPEEHEALSLLMEECGEVVQIIGKIFRHGMDSEHPDSHKVNRDELAKECADVLCAITILKREGIIEQSAIASARRAKITKFRYRPDLLHHIDPL